MRGTFGFIAQSGMDVQIQTRNCWQYFISTDRPQIVLGIAGMQIMQAGSAMPH
ncbi:MAG: hypothetical protein ONB44_10230 [candidate division KSB1 bacterium]|nr:hypothetical protein [candidate division KSB1 bacterium]MDZ7302501.1 hypothetical protein [candidate division KSB1 bacterium]MDZ7311903.1 hypothetical protein [candidate division KSB1 bacterium]